MYKDSQIFPGIKLLKVCFCFNLSLGGCSFNQWVKLWGPLYFGLNNPKIVQFEQSWVSRILFMLKYFLMLKDYEPFIFLRENMFEFL